MLKKLKVIALILIKILHKSDFISEENKNTLKELSEKIKNATNEITLNLILNRLLFLEQNLNFNLPLKENKIFKKQIDDFIKRISFLTKNNKYFKKVNEIYQENKNKDILDLFKKYTDFLENYLLEISKQEIKYNEISEVLNSMIETLAKLPKTNDEFKDKLFKIKEELEKTNDIRSIKKLKSMLVSMIDEIQIEITNFTDNINKTIEENLKYANLKIKALESKVDEVVKDSYLDSLTGALNRKWFNENFNDFYWFEKNNNHLFVIFDIDYFKLVNDTYGHKAGDIALKEVVERFKKVIRKEKDDRIIRYGGDEFLLILMNIDKNNVNSVLKRLIEVINSKPIQAEDNLMNITISMGASLFNEADTPEKLFAITDKKLYVSKENGRNRFTF